MQIHDTIVVGGGPGGGSAAYRLSQAGQRVLVLEKERLPRYKACGGAVSTRMLAEFPFSFDPVIASRVTSVTYTLGEQHVSFPLPGEPVCMVMRDQFDAYLLAQAQAEVRQGTAVRSVTELDDRVIVETRSGETFAARHLVAADGASSVVARALGLRRGKSLAAAIEAEVPVSGDIMSRFAGDPVFIFGEIGLGYLWIFPKAAHLSVGIAALHPKPGELQATLERVIARYGISLEGVRRHGHPLPLYLGRERISTARCLLVGDAAGLVDPFNGEGIRFAVKSGRLAAEAILSGQMDRYSERVQQEIGTNHAWALRLARLFYRFPRTCYALGVRSPFATRAFTDMLGEKTGYPGAIARLFGTLPVFLASEGVAALAGLVGGPGRREQVRAVMRSSSRS